MNKYECDVCGYVYDPAEHDGVAFEDLPDDWVCPICGQPKSVFKKAFTFTSFSATAFK